MTSIFRLCLLVLLGWQSVQGQPNRKVPLKTPKYALYECISKKVDTTSRKQLAGLVTQATSVVSLETALKRWANLHYIDDVQVIVQELVWPKETYVWIQAAGLGNNLTKLAGSRGSSTNGIDLMKCLFSDTLLVIDSLEVPVGYQRSNKLTIQIGKDSYVFAGSEQTSVKLSPVSLPTMPFGRYVNATVSYQSASLVTFTEPVIIYFFTKKEQQSFANLLTNWFSKGPVNCDDVVPYCYEFLQAVKGGKNCDSDDLYFDAISKQIRQIIRQNHFPCQP